MLNQQRLQNYSNQRHSSVPLPAYGLLAATSKQLRRAKHKQFSRKTHTHLDAWGDPCERCKPGWVPARERAAQ